MKRRAFIAGLGGVAAWPLAARAQQPPAKLPTIGFLGAATPAVANQWVAAFERRLRELGWIEARTIAIEYRWAEGNSDRYSEIAAEFIRLKVDAIVTWGAAPVLAAKRATAQIPIVFAGQADPVGAGMVASLARPGGNVTGLSLQQTDTTDKRLDTFARGCTQSWPAGDMANAGGPGAVREMGKVQATARAVGLQVTTFLIRQVDDIAPAIEALKSRADALYVATDPLMFTHRIRINALARGARLPTIYGSREYVDAGGLVSYAPNWTDIFRRAADYVDKILRGTKPGDIPVEQPTKFDLVVNLKTAKALDLELSPSLLARADEVIE
jgi:putative ABC transport system substrate-binding protein